MQRDCNESTSNPTRLNDKPNPSVNSNQVCSFCEKSGHDANRCFIRQNIEKRKSVKFCGSGKFHTSAEVRVDGICLTGMIDTGADISLIAQKHAVHRFCDPRWPLRVQSNALRTC